MKDIDCACSDGRTMTIYDSVGNSIRVPLNLDNCIKDVRYEYGTLVFINQNDQEIRICTDLLVNDSLNKITSYWNYDWSSPENQNNYSTNAILARITAKVLGEFLQTKEGVKAIEKELNNYFNGTS